MPALPTQLTTNITDVPVGASSAAIQAAINAAGGTNPVIHLPAGTYNLNQTITVPANMNLFILGDNLKTDLQRIGGSVGPMFELAGPSKATIRDMFIYSNNEDGILVLGADQPGARVFGEGIETVEDFSEALLADNLANTHVDMQGFGASRAGMVSVKSIGTGSPSASRVGIYGGTAGPVGGIAPADGWMYEVSNGGSMLLEDVWYESSTSPTVVNLGSADSGNFSYWGGNLGSALVGWSVIVDGFNGLASFLNLDYGIQVGGGITVVPSGQTQAFFLAQSANQKKFYTVNGAEGTVYFDDSQGQTAVGDTNSNFLVPDQPANALPVPTPPAFPASFIDNMLALGRTAQAEPVTDLPAGVTDARFYRLVFNNSNISLHITSSSTAPTPVPTPTVTRTVTSTFTQTPTITPTSTITPTFTVTPTGTWYTLTSTNTLTVTPTVTPTVANVQLTATVVEDRVAETATALANKVAATATAQEVKAEATSTEFAVHENATATEVAVKEAATQEAYLAKFAVTATAMAAKPEATQTAVANLQIATETAIANSENETATVVAAHETATTGAFNTDQTATATAEIAKETATPLSENAHETATATAIAAKETATATAIFGYEAATATALAAKETATAAAQVQQQAHQANVARPNGGNSGNPILAPVPVVSGEPLCLYNITGMASASWQVVNLMGERVANLTFGSGAECWNTQGVAPSIYIVLMKLTFSDGRMTNVTQKIVVIGQKVTESDGKTGNVPQKVADLSPIKVD
jgi:hypothetical protein